MRKLKTLFISGLLAAGTAVIGTACDDEGAAGTEPEPMAGACFDSSTTDYSKPGPYRWTRDRIAGFTVYRPLPTPGGCDRFPMVGFAMGTIMPTGLYDDYYEIFASWGIISVIDPANLLNPTGGSLRYAMERVMRHRDIADSILNLGALGHSQGGAAVVNIAMDQDLPLDAVVGLMPALFQGLGRVDAAGLYIGATADLFGVATDPGLAYARTDGPAFIAEMRGEGHIGGVSGDAPVAMSTAWFRCHLGKDANACDLFTQSRKNGTCSFPGRWSRCEGKND